MQMYKVVILIFAITVKTLPPDLQTSKSHFQTSNRITQSQHSQKKTHDENAKSNKETTKQSPLTTTKRNKKVTQPKRAVPHASHQPRPILQHTSAHNLPSTYKTNKITNKNKQKNESGKTKINQLRRKYNTITTPKSYNKGNRVTNTQRSSKKPYKKNANTVSSRPTRTYRPVLTASNAHRRTKTQYPPSKHSNRGAKSTTIRQLIKITDRIVNGKYPTKNPFDGGAPDNEESLEYDVPLLPGIPDVMSSEEEINDDNIVKMKSYLLEMTANISTTKTSKPFYKKYGTDPPRKVTTEFKFKDFIEKYEPMTVWGQIDRKRIMSRKKMTYRKQILALIKGIDYSDELFSLEVPNGHAKLPVPADTRRFREGMHNREPIAGFNFMHIHQYMIELMKQAIYQARNRMIFMQDLRSRYRTSGLYKMGFLFAKTDFAGKVFASVSIKAIRMCSMIRQGIVGVYRPFQHYLDIVYALERMEIKWFEVDLLADLLKLNDHMIRTQILDPRKNISTARLKMSALDKMFIE